MKIPDKPRAGFPVADTVSQIIDCLKAWKVVGIAGGRVQETPNGTTLFPAKATSITRSGRPDRFIVSLSGNDLSVSLGTVFFGDGGKDKRTYYPIEPTLDGVILSEDPSWDVADKPNDTLHKVFVVWSQYNYAARVELLEDDEEPEFETGENAVCVAEVTFTGEEENRSATIHQLWESDIPGWMGGDGTGSSGSGDSGDSQGGSSGDSSGIFESSLGSSSGSGSSETSSGSGVPCPVITSVTVVPFAIAGVIGASCFEDADDDGFAEGTYVTVHCHVEVSASPPGCRLYVRVQIGAAFNTVYLALHWGGGEVMVPVTFFAFPSTSYDVTTTIFQSAGFSGCDLEGCEPFETTYLTQPACP